MIHHQPAELLGGTTRTSSSSSKTASTFATSDLPPWEATLVFGLMGMILCKSSEAVERDGFRRGMLTAVADDIYQRFLPHLYRLFHVFLLVVFRGLHRFCVAVGLGVAVFILKLSPTIEQRIFNRDLRVRLGVGRSEDNRRTTERERSGKETDALVTERESEMVEVKREDGPMVERVALGIETGALIVERQPEPI